MPDNQDLPPLPERWHELKTDPDVFDAVAAGRKTFEIRLNDRDYREGDGLLLRRTRNTGWAMKNTGAPLEYTGQEFRAVVTHVLHGPAYGLAAGWVILSIAALSLQGDDARAVLEQALEALELHGKQYPHMAKGYCLDAISAIRSYLSKTAKEN